MKPTVPEVIDRFRAYKAKEGNGAWGALHVVLDDNNLEDKFVQATIRDAEEQGDIETAELAKILLSMSRTQRFKIGRLA